VTEAGEIVAMVESPVVSETVRFAAGAGFTVIENGTL
jgi:hypothetical protein